MRSEGQSILPPGHSGLLLASVGGGGGGGWRPFKLLFLPLLDLTGLGDGWVETGSSDTSSCPAPLGDGSVGGWGAARSSATSPSPAPLGGGGGGCEVITSGFAGGASVASVASDAA